MALPKRGLTMIRLYVAMAISALVIPTVGRCDDVYKCGINVLSDCVSLNEKVVNELKSTLDKVNELENLMDKCSDKGADISNSIADVKLSKRYLSDALQIYEWSYQVMDNMLSNVRSDESDTVIVDIIDGDNGILTARYYLLYTDRDVGDLSDMVNRAIDLCNDFLAGKITVDKFESDLSGVLSAGAGIVGLSASIRDSAYRVARVVDSAWIRMKADEKEESSVDALRSADRIRSTLTTLGVVLALVGAFYALHSREFFEFVSVFSEVLSELMSLVSELVTALTPSYPSLYASVGGGV